MTVTAISVASYVEQQIRLAPYETMKLQKLVYFSQAWSMAWTGRPLFNESFEAWPNGPVNTNVYREQTYSVIPGYTEGALDEATKAIIDSVLKHYGTLSSQQLVDMTHDHLPWQEARGKLAPNAASRVRLNQETIRRFYIREELAGRGPQRLAREVSTAGDADVRQIVARSQDRWEEALLKLA